MGIFRCEVRLPELRHRLGQLDRVLVIPAKAGIQTGAAFTRVPGFRLALRLAGMTENEPRRRKGFRREAHAKTL